MSTLRILVPIKYSELGGSQVFLLKLIDAFQGEKEVDFFCWLFEKGPLEKELQKRNIPFRFINFSLKKNPFSFFTLVKEMRNLHVDVIYLHASRLLAIAAKIAGIPCVERINMSRNSHTGGWCSNPLIDRFFTSCNTVALAVSDAIRQQLLFRGIKDSKITVIRNFVELDRYYHSENRSTARKALGIPEDRLCIINIGRFTMQKAQSDYVKVAAAALQKNPSLYFVLSGNGPLKDELEKEISALGIKDNIKIIPFRRDIEIVYYAADLMLHTAHWAPLDNVLLEGMAAGLPVIASDADGTREVIHDRDTGLLFPIGDIEKATELLLEAAKNLDLCNILGNNARKYVQDHHSIDVVKGQYLKMFQGLIKPR